MRKEREKASGKTFGKTFYISEKKKNELINHFCTQVLFIYQLDAN